MKFLKYFILASMVSCTAPTVPGILGIAAALNIDEDLDGPCGCLDPDEPTLVAIHCKEVNGKMVEASPTDSTHMCCIACMRKLGPAPKK